MSDILEIMVFLMYTVWNVSLVSYIEHSGLLFWSLTIP
jgi:hypothetical protein